MHHIFSLKAFTRMESSFIPSKVPTREFLSIRSLSFSHFQPPQTGESSFEELEVNSLSLSLFLSICFLELSTVINRSVLQRVWQRKFIA